jgi:hypothetical protein
MLAVSPLFHLSSCSIYFKVWLLKAKKLTIYSCSSHLLPFHKNHTSRKSLTSSLVRRFFHYSQYHRPSSESTARSVQTLSPLRRYQYEHDKRLPVRSLAFHALVHPEHSGVRHRRGYPNRYTRLSGVSPGAASASCTCDHQSATGCPTPLLYLGQGTASDHNPANATYSQAKCTHELCNEVEKP